jgi:hypothetical protein
MMTRFLSMVLFIPMARSNPLVLSEAVTRSRGMDLLGFLTRSDVLVLSEAVTRSPVLVLS